MGILVENSTQTFWQCFSQAINDNKKNYDGKRRALSIIADDFTYDELQKNLGVSNFNVISNIISDTNKFNDVLFLKDWTKYHFRIT
jgi:hypothetical protein